MERKRLEIKLVVLDWAGTTIDFGCMAPAGAFVATFAAKGVAVTMAEARAPMGLHKKDHIRALLRIESVAAKWHAAAGRDWTESDVEELYRDVTPRQVEAAERYSELIPGTLEAVDELRRRGIKIATTTGYFREAANAVLAAAKRQGYEPDFAICADDVPAGRPAPWMIYRCMEACGVYPPAVVAKVGDTIIDIEDGCNAGCWSYGVADSSNEMGLTQARFNALSAEEQQNRRNRIRRRFFVAGGMATINTIADLPDLLRDTNKRLAAHERPC